VGHVACMGEEKHVYKVFMGNPEGHCLGKLGIDGMILKCPWFVQLVHRMIHVVLVNPLFRGF